MRILFALPYGPTETRVRARMLLRELATRHEVTLLALAWDARDLEAIEAMRPHLAAVEAVAHGRTARVLGAAGDPRRPLQSMVSTSAPFARRARELLDAGRIAGRPFDVVHVEHLRGAAAIDLPSGLPVRTVYDAVDCIAELARLTAQNAPGRMVRGIARFEEPRTARYEARLLEAADVVTVVAERDRRALAAIAPQVDVQVVPNGVRGWDLPVTITPEPMAIFTGKLSYHANLAATQWLLDEIWPLVRLAVPNARLVLAGAEPPASLLTRAGSDGIEVVANPADMPAQIARSRVALAPIVYSVGMQNKVLEALACGVPVVATPAALAGIDPEGADFVQIGATAEQFAAETVRLLRGGDEAEHAGRQGFDWVTRRYSWEATARAFEALYAPVATMGRVA